MEPSILRRPAYVAGLPGSPPTAGATPTSDGIVVPCMRRVLAEERVMRAATLWFGAKRWRVWHERALGRKPVARRTSRGRRVEDSIRARGSATFRPIFKELP